MMAATVEITTRPTALQTEAPAKINLTLSVLGKRGDGFHEIRSLVIGVGLSDALTCTPRAQSGLLLSCSDPKLENDHNLAMIAGRAVATKCDPEMGATLHIDKRIPQAAGLGGGSSNAAAALRLCNRAWGARLSDDQLSAIGAGIGSDVPLFFSLPAAVVTGRGEIVQTVSMRWTGWVVLVHTGLCVPTADVYRAWSADEHQGKARPDLDFPNLLIARDNSHLHPRRSFETVLPMTDPAGARSLRASRRSAGVSTSKLSWRVSTPCIR